MVILIEIKCNMLLYFQNTLLEWRYVFWLSGGVVLLANSVYVLLASAEIQWWNDPVPTNEPNDL